jgi:hypothetical protein
MMSEREVENLMHVTGALERLVRHSREFREMVVAWRYWRIVSRVLSRAFWATRPGTKAASVLVAVLVCGGSCSS